MVLPSAELVGSQSPLVPLVRDSGDGLRVVLSSLVKENVRTGLTEVVGRQEGLAAQLVMLSDGLGYGLPCDCSSMHDRRLRPATDPVRPEGPIN